ncbi:YlzJ-like protein [Desulfonispora thiosulfatigenes DSM 11270]|uniref:YlzJ-like protein n=1 Tax=Desulfonispora thiosulfatigenes DSM 11270 TaxID=656914 RepID=A0A1W1VRM2_DESTI|nr:YlzJ-like family protein [Desulfonispora thiosulfatigenes]SMB96032.1 YlzJ-like protein [Desulfonispora thiosulfatigenes DSM 11270]
MADVLYTNVPLEVIMYEEPEPQNYQDIEYNGIQMQVEPLGWNKFRVVRIYSTDLSNYLNPVLQPGSIVGQ